MRGPALLDEEEEEEQLEQEMHAETKGVDCRIVQVLRLREKLY